jgi:phage-related protein
MQAIYYRTASGSMPVDEFISRLPIHCKAAVDQMIERLNRLEGKGPPLPFPYSSQVQGELRELRCHCGRRLYRILYRRSEALFILLHAFEKTSRRVPLEAVRLAEGRWVDFRSRMEAKPRVGPRPAGRDAP